MRAPLLAALGLGVLLAAGCGAAAPTSRAPSRTALEHQLAGSPPPLARIHSQANRLLPGGVDAYRERLRELRGHPIVVNVWASWCGPCREEFPLFQATSAKLGRRVAFLGVDTLDNAGDARKFLRSYPVSYPSYDDDDGRIARAAGASVGVPATAFYTRAGKRDYIHLGAYTSQSQLEQDIRRRALSAAD